MLQGCAALVRGEALPLRGRGGREWVIKGGCAPSRPATPGEGLAPRVTGYPGSQGEAGGSTLGARWGPVPLPSPEESASFTHHPETSSSKDFSSLRIPRGRHSVIDTDCLTNYLGRQGKCENGSVHSFWTRQQCEPGGGGVLTHREPLALACCPALSPMVDCFQGSLHPQFAAGPHAAWSPEPRAARISPVPSVKLCGLLGACHGGHAVGRPWRTQSGGGPCRGWLPLKCTCALWAGPPFLGLLGKRGGRGRAPWEFWAKPLQEVGRDVPLSCPLEAPAALA